MKAKDALFVILAFLFVWFVALPVLKGSLKLLIVLSGSMVPVMQVGDVIVVRAESPQEARLGDITAFKDPGGKPNVIITHRIVGINEGSNLSFQTKGDAVEDPDPFTVNADQVVGRAVFSIPALGYLVRSAKTPAAFFLFNIFPAALLIIGEVKKIQASGRPGLALRERREERRKARIPRKIDFGRLSFILAISFLAFAVISLPSLLASGHSGSASVLELKNAGPVQSAFFFRASGETFVPPKILPGMEEASITLAAPADISVSAAPYIMPVMWIEILSKASPYAPALASMFVPPLLLTLAFQPLWHRKAQRPSRGLGRLKRLFLARLYIKRGLFGGLWGG